MHCVGVCECCFMFGSLSYSSISFSWLRGRVISMYFSTRSVCCMLIFPISHSMTSEECITWVCVSVKFICKFLFTTGKIT